MNINGDKNKNYLFFNIIILIYSKIKFQSTHYFDIKKKQN